MLSLAPDYQKLRRTLLGIYNRSLAQLCMPTMPAHPAHGNHVLLSHIHPLLALVRFPDLPVSLPGWLTIAEQRMLYALAYLLPGPILEIGSWLGRSTACLAFGIRDSRQPKTLVSVDLNLKPEHFRPYGDQVGFFYPAAATQPLALVEVEQYHSNVAPVLHAPGGILQALRTNLHSLDLLDLVHIVMCDFRAAPRLPYRLIFCDVTHNPGEIAHNLPDLAHLLQPGTIVACHDIDDVNEACVRSLLPVRYGLRCDSLFVAEVGSEMPTHASIPFK
ncbi:MAG: class I SAM-dependent methyltransferase [Candidatus Viridilinea halotolerans]|uniref:Class I SAM-dependent methyltransferase n=1 Tax=Candidatus Viridilinea halotolerans TaxID=2491704 RepID=A0A426U1Q5_9CHLR|nr:MAG: class I SAM-dependent methyltransferase [Candidatus Viridilinea halotolerans]